MKISVDKFEATTGWAGSGAGATVHGINTVPDYIAGGNTGSVIFKFAAGNTNAYIQKTVAVDLTKYDELVFHFWSRNKQGAGVGYMTETDFAYKIDFGTGDVYYVPAYNSFESITIDVSNLTAITRIRITCLHPVEDYIILSEMVAVKDEFPLDIFQATKDQLDIDLAAVYGKIWDGTTGKGILVGTASGTAGDTRLRVEGNLSFVDRYAVIRIDDGIHSEIHQIEKADEVDFAFNSRYDGATLKYSYTAAPVYITIQTVYNPAEDQIILPGIAIWGMSPEEIMRGNKEDTWRDTFKTDGSVRSRLDPAIYKWEILIDCEARHNQLLALSSRAVRNMLSRKFLWINGKKIDIYPEGPATSVEAVEGYNQVPKVQYLMRLELREEIYDRTILPKVIDAVKTFDIM